jgi:hypothetical protein
VRWKAKRYRRSTGVLIPIDLPASSSALMFDFGVAASGSDFLEKVGCPDENNAPIQPPVPDQAFRHEWELARGVVWFALPSIRSKSPRSNVWH